MPAKKSKKATTTTTKRSLAAKKAAKTRKANKAARTTAITRTPSWFSGCEETSGTGEESSEASGEEETETNATQHTHKYEGEMAKEVVKAGVAGLNHVMNSGNAELFQVHVDGDPLGNGYSYSAFTVDQREQAIKNGLEPYVLRVQIEAIPTGLDVELS